MFVYTIADVIGVAFWGIVIILFVLCFIMEKVQDFFKRFKKESK